MSQRVKKKFLRNNLNSNQTYTSGGTEAFTVKKKASVLVSSLPTWYLTHKEVQQRLRLKHFEFFTANVAVK